MKRLGTILVAIAVVAAALTVPLGVAAAVDGGASGTNASDSIAPGERLAGTVGVQRAAVDGDLDNRTYEARLNRAETDDERAAIVSQRVDEIDRRLVDHERRLAELRAEREAGNLSDGAYRARVASIAAENANTERAAERTERTARGLPEDALREQGVNVDAIGELRANASRLGGGETAEIARQIGGPNATNPPGEDRRRGPPADTEGPASDTPGTNESNTVGDNRTASGVDGHPPETNGTGDERRPGGENSGNGGTGDAAADSGDRGGTSHTDADRSQPERGNSPPVDNDRR